MSKLEINARQVDAHTTANAGGSFKRRNYLAKIESAMQKLWKESRIYESSAPVLQQDFFSKPVGEFSNKDEKFFCTFPYPYMNGRLHLGHAFTITKAEFQARYQRLHGKRVLWPFAFHCTGMPIAACADKLRREIEERGQSGPNREGVPIDVLPLTPLEEVSESPSSTPPLSPPIIPHGKEAKEIGKFSGKKSKTGQPSILNTQ